MSEFEFVTTGAVAEPEFVTTVYKFGIGRRPRGESRALLLSAMHESHHLKNRLIQLERARREAVRSIQYRHPVVGPLVVEYERQRSVKAAIKEAVAAAHEPELERINARIAEATHCKPRRSTKDLVDDRKALEKRIKDQSTKATRHITARMKELADEMREAKEQHAAELVPQYEQVTSEIKPFQDAAVNAQTEEEAAEFGYEAHEQGHTYTRWFTLKAQQKSYKDRGHNLSPAKDPKFRTFRPGYLTNTIREGTLCAGMSQTDDGGRLVDLNTPNKGKLCILQPPLAGAYDAKVPRSHRKRLQRTKVLFRVGERPNPGKGRALPLWAELEDVIFHREIPTDAVITEALVKLESVGAREKWFLILTIDVPKRAPIVPATATTVVIQQSTQVLEGELQYAELLTPTECLALTFNINPRAKVRRFKRFGPEADGSYGWSGFRRDANDTLRRFQNGELFPPGDKHIQNIFDYQERICGNLDANFNRLILGETGVDQNDNKYPHIFCVMDYIQNETLLPKPLQDAKVNNVHKWRSRSKFQKLYRAWRDQRVEGDEAAFALMYEWAYQDLHLHQWARDMLIRAIQRRENEFRVVSNWLCRNFMVIYLDNRAQLNLVVDKNDSAAAKVRKWRKRAAFGTFREILRSTARRLGVAIHGVDPAKDDIAQLLSSEAAAAE